MKMSWTFVPLTALLLTTAVNSQCTNNGCQLSFQPVCDNRGTTYLNPCWFTAAQCRRSVEGIQIERTDCSGYPSSGSSGTYLPQPPQSIAQIIGNPPVYPMPYAYYNPAQQLPQNYMALPPSGCNLMTLRPELDSRWAQLMQNLQIGNPQAIADLFTVDNVYVTPDAATVRNRTVVQEFFKALIQGGVTNLENFPEDVICFNPEWAFERGYHKLYSTGNNLVKVARHTVLWHRLNGIWQFHMVQITEDCTSGKLQKKATKS